LNAFLGRFPLLAASTGVEATEIEHEVGDGLRTPAVARVGVSPGVSDRRAECGVISWLASRRRREYLQVSVREKPKAIQDGLPCGEGD
jgi:hypothetical protein